MPRIRPRPITIYLHVIKWRSVEFWGMALAGLSKVHGLTTGDRDDAKDEILRPCIFVQDFLQSRDEIIPFARVIDRHANQSRRPVVGVLRLGA